MKLMAPDNLLVSLKAGIIAPFYLFYGPEDFWIELILDKIKKRLLPDSVKDFNLDILYADDAPALEVLNRARSVPFLSQRRVIIVRGTEKYAKGDLEHFITYLDSPVESSCIIWISAKAEFNNPFYRRCRELGAAVNFKKLTEGQVYGWMHKRAEELGMRIDSEAAGFLYHMVGSNMRDMYSELWKLSLRFPRSRLGLEQIKDVAIFSRLFTVFDFVDHVSRKDAQHALETLHRLFETQGRDTPTVLGILGMVARQIRLICQAKAGVRQAKGKIGVVERLKPLPDFVIEKCIAQEKLWGERQLIQAFSYIYEADGFMRTGSRGDLVMENLAVQLCHLLD